MLFTAASILSHGHGFILLTVAIETDKPMEKTQPEDVNSTKMSRVVISELLK